MCSNVQQVLGCAQTLHLGAQRNVCGCVALLSSDEVFRRVNLRSIQGQDDGKRQCFCGEWPA